MPPLENPTLKSIRAIAQNVYFLFSLHRQTFLIRYKTPQSYTTISKTSHQKLSKKEWTPSKDIQLSKTCANLLKQQVSPIFLDKYIADVIQI